MSEISPKLELIHSTLKSILEKLQKCEKNPNVTVKDLRGIQDQLHGIDEQYKEARIVVDDEVPKGQAVIADLLSEAHDRVTKLMDRNEE
jgi:hypothetical protein